MYKDVGNKMCSQGAPFFPQCRSLKADAMVEYLYKAVQTKLSSVEQTPVKLATQIVECLDLLLQAAHRSGLPLDAVWDEHVQGKPLGQVLRVLSGSTVPLERETKVGRKCWLCCSSFGSPWKRPATVLIEANDICSAEVEWEEKDPIAGPVGAVRWYDAEPESKPFMYLLPRS
jgi:hypothetical protein